MAAKWILIFPFVAFLQFVPGIWPTTLWHGHRWDSSGRLIVIKDAIFDHFKYFGLDIQLCNYHMSESWRTQIIVKGSFSANFREKKMQWSSSEDKNGTHTTLWSNHRLKSMAVLIVNKDTVSTLHEIMFNTADCLEQMEPPFLRLYRSANYHQRRCLLIL